jgi:Icc-related predicted phosphoesterase
MASVRIAAAGDLHADERVRPRIDEAFGHVAHVADLVLLAGDLTAHGEPQEMEIVAAACARLDVPVYSVLGNHDYHSNKVAELTSILEAAGVFVLERSWTTATVNGTEIGIAGTKGFVGGFPGSTLPDFGEPLLREVYAETGEEVAALDRSLAEVGHCPLRVVLLHYSPTMSTLVGEPESIWTYLGSNRLDGPIQKHRPDVVLHGHAHAGTFSGAIGPVPVYNVAVHVMRRDFFVFELDTDVPDGHAARFEATV